MARPALLVLVAVASLVSCRDDDPGTVTTADEDDLRRTVVFETAPFDDAQPRPVSDSELGVEVAVPVSGGEGPSRFLVSSIDLLVAGAVWHTAYCDTSAVESVHLRGWLEMAAGFAPVELTYDADESVLRATVFSPTVDTRTVAGPTYQLDVVGCDEQQEAALAPLLVATIDPTIGCDEARPIDPPVGPVGSLVPYAYSCRIGRASAIVLLTLHTDHVPSLVEHLGRDPVALDPCPGEARADTARRSQMWIVHGPAWVLTTHDPDLAAELARRPVVTPASVNPVTAPPTGYPTTPDVACE